MPDQIVAAGIPVESAPAPVTASGTLPPSSGEPAKPAERAFPAPADLPTQQGSDGVRFDFNDGCRLVVAEGGAPSKIRLKDLDTGNILFETELKAGRVNSSKRYYVRFRIELLQDDKLVFAHDY